MKIDIRDDLVRMFEQMAKPNKPAKLNISPAVGAEIAQNLARSCVYLPDDDASSDDEIKQTYQVDPSIGDEPTASASTLPKVIEMLPDSNQFFDMKWQQIKNLPGYAQSGIRNMGRQIFESLDCFSTFSAQMKNKKKDGLAEVLVVSDFTHDQGAVNFLVDTILKHGTLLNVGKADHDKFLPDYQPDIMIFMTENWTFKLVQDNLDNGAPVELNSIYAWPGGLKHYGYALDHPKAQVEESAPHIEHNEIK